MVSVAGSPSTSSDSCPPKRSRRTWRSRSGPGTMVQPVSLLPAFHARGRVWDLSGFLAIPPMPLPCSKTPTEPTGPRLVAVLPMLPPGPTHRRPQLVPNLEANTGLQHPLPTLHEGRCRRPCKARFRLAGCAFAGRELNPLDRIERFQVTSILLSRISPDASRI